MQITTPDKKTIYGTLDSVDADTILIFVHGFTGGQNEHMYFNAAPFYNHAGFDVFRFSFYSRQPNARQLSECTFQTHIDDLNLVISQFEHKKKILIGHSLGCIFMLKADLKKIDQLILWDPASRLISPDEKAIYFEEKLDKFILRWGREILVNKQLIEEWQEVDIKKLLGDVKVPYNFIFAGECNKLEKWNFIPTELYSIVPGATHRFVEKGTLEELYKTTLSVCKEKK